MTELQMRKLLKKIWIYRDKLQHALNDAHNAGLIVYEKYPEQAPCWALYEMERRVVASTQEIIAEMVHQSVKKEVRGF